MRTQTVVIEHATVYDNEAQGLAGNRCPAGQLDEHGVVGQTPPHDPASHVR
jgi:hypothetical protein